MANSKKEKKKKVEALHIKGNRVMPTGHSLDSPLKKQIDGNHYSKHPIQPIEIAYLYNLTPGATLALRYLLRYRDKGGQTDVQKLKHLIELIEELEYNGQVDKLKELLKAIDDEENENPAS